MIPELTTVRDFFRYAVSRFNEAQIAYGHGTTNAVDEAAFLVLQALRLPVDRLDPFLDATLLPEERERLARLIDARVVERKPAAYLLGCAYLRGESFEADPRAIIPRSFIGELLDGDLFDGGSHAFVADPASILRVLDLCAGAGSLAILAARTFPHAAIDAVDLSQDALDLARRNVEAKGLAGRIRLIAGDLFDPVRGETYDLILSNPPYVDAQTMAALPPEHRHEPVLALAGGDDGLDVVRRILSGARDALAEDGALLCEVGAGRERLEAAYPDTPFLWLDAAEGDGEVFWLPAADLPR
jgi:ribosomal protein L3 glutamine methyltransferase